ncbi:GbsR/MarR family transcriptional regulator [Streptomyces sp. NPDC060205]|uniref:GbsR/MarR family transcriptional regulator n=1 Tax=Streptomyces sp. NPDC060205 TaxID=3347072 RepID=UPI003659722A
MSRSEAANEWQEELTERLAEHFAERMPKAAARMLGALMATEEVDMSSKDLIGVLGLSPAAVSNSGRLLLRMGLVERSVSPDTRRDHYRVRDDLWIRMFREGSDIVDNTLTALDAALSQTQGASGRAIARLRDMRDFYWFLGQEMPAVLDRYEAWQAEQRGRPEA